MVFNSFLEYTEWGQLVGISDAADLNEIVSKGNYNEVIRLSEAYYESQQLVSIARIDSKSYSPNSFFGVSSRDKK